LTIHTSPRRGIALLLAVEHGKHHAGGGGQLFVRRSVVLKMRRAMQDGIAKFSLRVQRKFLEFLKELGGNNAN